MRLMSKKISKNKQEEKSVDSYEEFFKFIKARKVKERAFFNWAFANTYFYDVNEAVAHWNTIVANKQAQPIRPLGKDRKNKTIYKMLKSSGIKVKVDTQNNVALRKFLKKKTLVSGSGRKRVRDLELINYQYAHVWDRMTKNPFAFNSLWNVVRIPKIADAFSGEIKGRYKKNALIDRIKTEIFKRYNSGGIRLIDEYNRKIKRLDPSFKKFISKSKNPRDQEHYKTNFKLIKVSKN